MAEEKKNASKEAQENKEAPKAPEAKSETKSKPAKKTSKKKIRITCHNAAGKYGLGYSHGDIALMEAKQADEMIEAKDAEEVK